MALVNLQLSGPVNYNVDESAIPQGQNAYLMDGYFDENGALNRRPGLASAQGVGTGGRIDGLYWWREQNNLLTVSNGKLIVRDSADALQPCWGADLLTTGLVVFAQHPSYIFMASGGKLFTWVGIGYTAATVASTPEPTSSVGYLDSYILAPQNNTNKFYWSSVSNPLTWNALDFASASGAPDYISRLAVGWREIVLFGTDSTEVWYNDGSTPFSRMQGAFIESGIGSSNSLVNVDNVWWYLDHNRNIVALTGRSPSVVSFSASKFLHSLTTVEDCSTYVVNGFGRKWIVFNFCAAGKTLVYDTITKIWSEWGYFNTAVGYHENFLGRTYAFDRTKNRHYFGSNVADTIFRMSDTAYLDDMNAMPVKVVLRTGQFTHGTYNRKKSNRLKIRLLRGVASASTIQFEIKWRDNNQSAWNQERRFSIGTYGDVDSIIEIQNPGVYRSRQYEISCSGNAKFVLIGIEEDVEVLES